MKLIITEKPKAAQDIATSLGIDKKEDGFFSCGEFCVTWARGHLFELDDSPYRKEWSLATLPILPNKLTLAPKPDCKKEIRVIHSLIRKANQIIVATDAGREGELIAREILENYNGSLPSLYRFWSSQALTKNVILDSLNSLKPLSDYDSLYFSAKSRQESDWIVGINLSRLFSLKGNGRFSVGRVQTPTLSVIVERDRTIESFKPEMFATIPVCLRYENSSFEGLVIDPEKELNQDRFLLRTAEEFTLALGTMKRATVTKIEKFNNTRWPPSLYSLTLLQRAANKKYGYSAQETLDIAQSLYEKEKCLSYPRTDSTVIGESNIELAKNCLSLFAPELIPNVEKTGKRVFNNELLTDHHAIIPLSNYQGNNQKEFNVFDLVRKAFIAAFMPPYREEKQIITLKAEPFHLPIVSVSTSIQEIGWKAIYDESVVSSGHVDVKEGGSVDIISVSFKKGFTTAPPVFTEESLLGFMERNNLGTPATRASIIEKLAAISYIVKSKGTLVSTTKGRELVDILGPSSIKDPTLTSIWENKLEAIYKQDERLNGYLKFIEEIKDFTVAEVIKFKQEDISITRNATEGMLKLAAKLAKESGNKTYDKSNTSFDYVKDFIDGELGKAKETVPCPCGKGDIGQTARAWSCGGCNKTIWKETFGKKITFEQAYSLFNNEKVKISGLKYKNGNKYNGYLFFKEGKLVSEKINQE